MKTLAEEPRILNSGLSYFESIWNRSPMFASWHKAVRVSKTSCKPSTFFIFRAWHTHSFNLVTFWIGQITVFSSIAISCILAIV